MSLLTQISSIPHNFDSGFVVAFFEDYLDVLQYVVVLYVLLVTYGPSLLESLQYGNDPAEKGMTPEEKKQYRAPREARFQRRLLIAMRIWNLTLAFFSFFGAVALFHTLGYLFTKRTFYQVNCEFDAFALYDGQAAFWIFSFMVSKIPEMMDTVFLILQKKQVIFLHSYHHVTVAVFCWYAGRSLYPPGIVFNGMNYFVHTLMYFYYFFSSFKPLRRFTSVFAPLVTFLQILQMVLGFAICLYVSYYSFVFDYGKGILDHRGHLVHSCYAEKRVTRMGLLMYGSYFFLFVAFFADKYLHRSKGRAAAPANPPSALHNNDS